MLTSSGSSDGASERPDGRRMDRDRNRDQDDDGYCERGIQQGRLPLDGADQPLHARHHSEGPERSGSGDDTESRPPPLLRDHLRHGAEDDHVRRRAQRQADHHPEAQVQRGGRGSQRQQRKPHRVQGGADHDYPARTDAVGDHAGQRQPEHDVLHRHRQAEGLAPGGQGGRYRLQEQPERLPGPHRDGHGEGAEQDDHRGTLHGGAEHTAPVRSGAGGSVAGATDVDAIGAYTADGSSGFRPALSGRH